jgi:Restriction Enzyme Adenine Methylase Associated
MLPDSLFRGRSPDPGSTYRARCVASAARDQVGTPRVPHPARSRRDVTLADLVDADVLPTGTTLLAPGDVEIAASVLSDGRISFNGQTYDSPSAAAANACGRSRNGWTYWIADLVDGVLACPACGRRTGPPENVLIVRKHTESGFRPEGSADRPLPLAPPPRVARIMAARAPHSLSQLRQFRVKRLAGEQRCAHLRS